MRGPTCTFWASLTPFSRQDFARITHAWPLQIGWGGGFRLQRDAAGNPLWDEVP
jgi:hypothetical protein